MALALGIPERREESKIGRMGMMDRQVNSKDLGEQLTQWRILFHLQNLFDLEISDLQGLRNGKQICLQIKLFDFITCFKMNKAGQIIHPTSPYPLNFLRVHYFFTQNTIGIETLFEKSTIEIRLTEGEDWQNTIAYGENLVFDKMNPLHTDRVQTQSS